MIESFTLLSQTTIFITLMLWIYMNPLLKRHHKRLCEEISFKIKEVFLSIRATFQLPRWTRIRHQCQVCSCIFLIWYKIYLVNICNTTYRMPYLVVNTKWAIKFCPAQRESNKFPLCLLQLNVALDGFLHKLSL